MESLGQYSLCLGRGLNGTLYSTICGVTPDQPVQCHSVSNGQYFIFNAHMDMSTVRHILDNKSLQSSEDSIKFGQCLRLRLLTLSIIHHTISQSSCCYATIARKNTCIAL
jgi:hypothetical protein